MKRRKALSLLLILTILLSLVVPATSALADDDTSGGNGDKTKGMSISKTASYDEKTQKYTITLEAFATGEKITSVVSQDVPTDIVLVIDQSSSMTDPIGSFEFTEYVDESGWDTTYHTRNQDYYDCRHNGGSSNLWHKLADDTYVSVSVTMQESLGYTAITNGRNNSTWYGSTNYWNNRNNLYALVNGEYQKVTVSRSGNARYPTFTYTLPDNTTIATSQGAGSSPEFSGIEGNVLYLATADSTKTVYTYTYTDAAGNEQTIGTSTGASNTNFDDETKITFYKRTVNANGGGTRLAAIKAAVTEFANAVHEKAKGIDGQFGTADDVKHRIAMVGFATGDYSGSSDYPAYENTELFIGSAQHNYSTDASSYYASAFQDMSTQEGYNNVLASKDVLAARGATRTDLGILMANEIFNANPLQPTEKRNRIMIVFTDGVPSSWSGYNSTVAQNAINYAATAKTPTKDGGYGATVYGIGIFSGADATSAGSTGQGSTDADKGNYFLQNVSSNNGTPQSRSYYLSAGDMGTLSSIFQQISGNIETGGSSTTLGSETVVKDIISPYFKLPEGTELAGIRIDTYDCTGKTGDTYSWNSTSGGNGGATADISTDGQVNVTGFDFSANWCGLDNGAPHGKKLVISFEVEPKSGFLGGNSVDTNGGAYIYENGEANTPLMEFEKPIVNVPIPALTVGAMDKNVYLLGNVTADEIRSGVTVSVGGVALNLDPTVPNYGLADWQTKYVDINITYKDATGKVLADMTGLTDNTTYSVEVSVTPKPVTEATVIGPTAEAKSGGASGKINVFKPELTFHDSEVYYGDTVPEAYNNLTSTVWKHGETLDTAVTMAGTAPTLALTYTPDSNKIADGKINTKQDIAVDVTVKIGEADVTTYTTFQHTNCADKTCAVPTDKEFLLHVKTCTLTITKTGGAANESYVFDVYKDGIKYSEVAIWGNSSQVIYELPVGTYSITEKTDWSWRYTPSYSNNGQAELTATAPNGEITCTNAHGDNYKWLNGFSTIVPNIFGQASTPATDTTGNN